MKRMQQKSEQVLNIYDTSLLLCFTALVLI